MLRLNPGLAQRALQPRVYNGLPSLEKAAEFVRSQGLIDKMLGGVGSLFVRHGVAEHWGIYLLHKHWHIGQGEIPAEDVCDDTPEKEHVMRPISLRQGGGYVPITYTLRDGVFVGLEFSRTPQALEAHKLLGGKETFFEELKQVLYANGLSRDFGLGLIRENNDPSNRWVEFTAHSGRKSVMKYLPQDGVAAEHLIQASWAFAGQPAN